MSARAFVPVLHGAAADRPDEQDTVVAAQAIAGALERLGFRSEIVHMGLDLGAVAALAKRHPAVVFNLVEALEGDAGLAHLAPSSLDHFGVAYTGGSAESMCATLSKTGSKRLLRSAGLPTPAWSLDGRRLDAFSLVIVKSVSEHASLGIDAASVVPPERAAAEIGARHAALGGRFFAEAFIEGREFNLSVIETAEGPRVLPVAEIDFVGFPEDRPRIVDYEAKWEDGSFAYANTPRRFDFPADDAPLLRRLEDLARAAWDLFDLVGYARVDFRVDAGGEPWILEVNVNPCLSPDAGFAAAAARAGMGYDDLIGTIVETALARSRKAAHRVRTPGSNAGHIFGGLADGPESAKGAHPAGRNGQSPSGSQAAGLAWRESVRTEDVEGIRALVAATGMFTVEEIDIAAELVSERIEKGRASGYEFVMLEEAGHLVGYACYGQIPGSDTSYDLYWIVVDADRQGRGLGRQILARAELAMARKGARQIHVDTSSTEKYVPTRAFYLANGYAVATTLVDFYRPGDGKVIFVKHLGT